MSVDYFDFTGIRVVEDYICTTKNKNDGWIPGCKVVEIEYITKNRISFFLDGARIYTPLFEVKYMTKDIISSSSDGRQLFTQLFYKIIDNFFESDLNTIWNNVYRYRNIKTVSKTNFMSIFEVGLCLNNIDVVADIGNNIEKYVIFLAWFLNVVEIVFVCNCGSSDHCRMSICNCGGCNRSRYCFGWIPKVGFLRKDFFI